MQPRLTRDDLCRKGHSLKDAYLIRVDIHGEKIRCRTCLKESHDREIRGIRPIKKHNSKARSIDWDAVDSALEYEPVRDIRILFMDDIGYFRWTVLERVDGSKIIIKAGRARGDESVETFEYSGRING